MFVRVLVSEFPSQAGRKRQAPLVTCLVRTSSTRGTWEMQGWDQPATRMEPDLGWVSGFSQGETHPLWEGEPERSLPESLHCAAGAEES